MATRNGSSGRTAVGQRTPIKIGGRTLVFIDLETTGLEADCDIVQIAALYGESLFNRYIWPSRPISPRASSVNKITVNAERTSMYVNGKCVEHVDPGRAMTDFARFIQQVPGEVVLVAHNGQRFDFPRLQRVMTRHQVAMPSNVVSFLDSLYAFKSLWPGLKSYKLQSLVVTKLDRDSPVDAHTATADVEVLQDLMAFVPQARLAIVERYFDDSQLCTVEQLMGSLSI